MTKIMLWPDIYKEQGHWLPTINLAKSLQDAGYTVDFMGIADCEPIVTQYGGRFTTILEDVYPRGYTYENELEPQGQRWKPHHLLPIANGCLDNVFNASSADRPDLLIGGFFAGLEMLLIHYKYDIPILTLTTYLRPPSEDPAIHAAAKLRYMSGALAAKIMEAVVPADTPIDIMDFVLPLETCPEMIPCPREFDFYDDEQPHNPNVSYVEPMIERASLDGVTMPDDPMATLPSDKKIIFATSGSMVEDYLSQAQNFFQSLIDMMSTYGMSNYHLVLGVGRKLYTEFMAIYAGTHIGENIPQNVSIFPWVSQLDILKKAEVVYMHGGLATIKESIWEEVPIIIVPHGKDQFENSLRIKNTNVGIINHSNEISPLKLRNLLTKATTDIQVRRGLAKMKAIFEGMENQNPPPSVQIVSSVVPAN